MGDKVHNSVRPEGATVEKDIWGDVVMFDYVEAVAAYAGGSSKGKKRALVC
jgi:hypothetical protein